jgi:hypothetical protein
MQYQTCIIPWEPDATKRTRWHPTEPTGPFATLSRGAFYATDAAHTWAKQHLGEGATYSLRAFDDGQGAAEAT